MQGLVHRFGGWINRHVEYGGAPMSVPEPEHTPGAAPSSDPWLSPGARPGSASVPRASTPAPEYAGVASDGGSSYAASSAYGPGSTYVSSSPYASGSPYGAGSPYAPGAPYAPGSPYATGPTPYPTGPAGYPGYQGYPGTAAPYGYGYSGPQYMAPPRPTNGLATGALATGISALVGVLISVGVLGVLGGIVGIGLGIAALRRVRQGAPGRAKAIWGIVTSVLAMVAGTAFFLAIADDLGDSWDEGYESSYGDDGYLDGYGTESDYDAGWSDGWDEGYDAGWSQSTEPMEAPFPGDPNLHELALGETTTIGTFDVTVTDIQIDADEIVLGASADNYPALGQYVTATVAVTNTGNAPARPIMEMLASYWGSDDLLYDEWNCQAFTPRPIMEVGLVEPGASAEYEVCMDVPVEAIGDVSILIDDMRTEVPTGYRWTAGSGT